MAESGTFFGVPSTPRAPRPAAPRVPGQEGSKRPAVRPVAAPGSSDGPAVRRAGGGDSHDLPAVRKSGTNHTLNELLTWIYERDASDLHLASDTVPKARLHGLLREIPGTGPISAKDLEEILYGIMNDRQRDQFDATNDLDMAYALGQTARFRVNIFRGRGKVGAVMRLIPTRVKTCAELGLSPHIAALSRLSQGLVLLTGPTGSGKSTTMAALINEANENRRDHILTIEDPIEFTHRSKLCTVTQREVGEDTATFASGLRAALREDPDVILVGEMRDLETTRAALEAAETGHLVFASLHTKSAPETVSRIVNQFPEGEQAQIQTTLASALEAIVTQTLVRTVDGTGRTMACEVMMLAADSRNLIRAGKLEQLPSVLQTGADRGMHTMSHDLARLVREGRITYESAVEKAPDRSELDSKIKNRMSGSRRA